MPKKSSFPGIFWIANIIEIFERFAYYGIYMGFGIYVTNTLGFSENELGNIQRWFLVISYTIPFIAGTFADKYGFKKVMLVSYLTYLPSVLLLLITKTYSGVAFTMMCIAFAAGIFKPLVSGTIRVVTDQSNKTMGFGIFYLMVNFGASFGPLIAGKLRLISWNYAFIAGAIAIFIMFLITLFFYKEPPRDIEGISLSNKLRDIWTALSDVKFSIFLILLGFFFWTPYWSFFNLLAMYIDNSLDTAILYQKISNVLGVFFTNIISGTDKGTGVSRILGESIAHTGFIIIIFQFFVSKITQKTKPIPTFLFGIFIAVIGFIFLGYSRLTTPVIVFAGIFFIALGEMVSSPRIQEYITWLAPKEKAGLYMGANFLSIGIGGYFSGFYTGYFGNLKNMGHPEYIWFILGGHCVAGIIILWLYTRILGNFKENET